MLELKDLRTAAWQISCSGEISGMPLKEQAAFVKKLLEDTAHEHKIVLKLRKKKKDRK